MSGVVDRKLTKKQMALVDNLVATGCTLREAAHSAGYADGESGRVSASRTIRLPHVQQYMMQRVTEQLGLNATVAAPHVQQYMMQRVTEQLGLNATVAASKVMQLASGAKSEYVQLQAAQDILDRAGFKPIDRSQVQVAGDIRVTIDLG